MTTLGVSYWGRDPRRASKDAARIVAAGFSWVNVPISEERMAYDFVGTCDVLAAFKSAGLETRVSPWGVGGLFGGEGVKSDRDPMEAVDDWQFAAHNRDLNADAIYWDEPKGAHGATAVAKFSAWAAMPQHIYLNPKVGVPPDDDALARMASIGIDCYDGELQRAADEADGLASQYGKPIHVWVRAFRIARGNDWQPWHHIRMLHEVGVNDIAIWGYPSPGVSCLNSDRPRKVWKAVVAAMEQSA